MDEDFPDKFFDAIKLLAGLAVVGYFVCEAVPWLSGVLLTLAAVVGVLILVYAVYKFSTAPKRRKELLSWAKRRHLSLSAAPYYGMDDDHPAFKCLQGGDNPYACNLMEGKWSGRSFQAFDYKYGKNWEALEGSNPKITTRVRRISAVLLESEMALKPLLIRPEGVADRAAEILGANEIKFESADFSRIFHVESPDRKWAYDVLHPRAMEFLLSMPRFAIQFDERSVIVYRDCLFEARDFEDAAKLAQGLLDGLPEYVKAQQQKNG